MGGFSEWLFRQKDREDAVGVLAWDASQDADWPPAGTFRTYSAYLFGIGAEWSFLEGFRDAWREWEAGSNA